MTEYKTYVPYTVTNKVSIPYCNTECADHSNFIVISTTISYVHYTTFLTTYNNYVVLI